MHGEVAPPRTWAREPVSWIVGRLRAGGPALVALSGGVDSSLVAAIAHEALGDAVVAATVASVAVPPREVARAAELARALGLRSVVLSADPLARDDYRVNRADRCYVCRTVETSVLLDFGSSVGITQYLDGIHLDDLADDRPGIRAMNEAGFHHPLLEAGWRKPDVREEARTRGLANWDLPSDACLASRVPHGTPITSELLQRVAAAETVLVDRGFRRVRVRVRGERGARLEVDPAEVGRLLQEPLATEVRRAVRSLGFSSVTVAPEGYRGPVRSGLPMVR